MKIDCLELENFGPFYGRHRLDLDVAATSPVVLVHGENMRGKTSLQNAIRWCLYGEAVSRIDAKKPTYRLISLDALGANEWFMNVALEFRHDGHRYRLERHVQARHLPGSDADLAETATLKKDGHLLPEREILNEVGNILHQDISRFFLFDGEMLSQYEMLVADPNRSTEIIKQSIERILGLPSLKLATRDLRELFTAAQARQTKSIKRESEAAAMAAESEWLESEVNAIEDDLRSLRIQLDKYKEDRDALAERRDRFAEIQVDVRAAEDLTNRIGEARAEQSAIKLEIQQRVGEAWWSPVTEVALTLRDRLQSAITTALEARDAAAALQQTQRHLEAVCSEETCPVCKQAVRERSLDAAKAALDDVKTRLASFDVPDATKDQKRLTALQRFIGSHHLVSIQEKEKTYRQLNLRIYRDEQQLSDVNERLRGHDRAEIRRVQEEYDRVVGEIREIERTLGETERRRDEKQSALTSTRQKIARLPAADKRIVKETEMYDALIVSFDKAMLEFRDDLRAQVQNEASDIFGKLTTESGYRSLDINDQYGLQIIDDQGRPIHERSAGAEQIVALALIGALNRCTVRQGPIVMDTPFGRLDESHRANILAFVPSMSEQVVLLVQSGELNEDRDLVHLDGKIGRRYRLVRDGSPTKSRIEVVGRNDG